MEHGVGRTGPARIRVRLKATTGATDGHVLLQFGLDMDVDQATGLAEGARCSGTSGTAAHFFFYQILNTSVRVRGGTGRDTVRTVVQEVTGRPTEHLATGGRRWLRLASHPGSH